MASLFLIRHCQPEITGVLLGQMDPPLSGEGRLHAATALAGIQVEVVWTSPLRRARETADLINAHRVVEIPELREIDQGEWTGKTWAEVEATWSDLASRKSSDWLGVPAPGGEAWSSLADRVQRAWGVIRTGPAPAAVIGHQGVNAALANLIDGRNPLEFTQHYGEVILLEYD
jgi:alpha-ribazole phosphatase